jgi:predicted transcriptional regulator
MNIMTTTSDVLRLIADDKTLQIFETIATVNGNDSSILLSGLGLTKKMFYQRIYQLKSLGLVRKLNGCYHLTSFGKIIYKINSNTQEQILTAIKNYYNFVIVDSMAATDIPEEEQSKIIEHLFDGQEVKEILV